MMNHIGLDLSGTNPSIAQDIYGKSLWLPAGETYVEWQGPECTCLCEILHRVYKGWYHLQCPSQLQTREVGLV
jgi:hypothetical protein